MAKLPTIDLFCPGLLDRILDWRTRGQTIPSLPGWSRFFRYARVQTTTRATTQTAYGALPTEPSGRQSDSLIRATTPALHRASAADPWSWLCQSFQITTAQGWPLGALRLLGEGGDPSADHWLCVDPVYVHPDMERLILHRIGKDDVPLAEAAALISALNRHFREDGWEISATQSASWYLRLESDHGLVTHPLTHAIGRSVADFLPTGANAARWRAQLNEAQMLLATHPVNTQREARGQLPINSIWPWGEGNLPEPGHSPWASITTAAPILVGIAKLSGTLWQDWPSSAADCRAEFTNDCHLFMTDAFWQANLEDDYNQWVTAYRNVDHCVLQPLLTGIDQHRIGRLDLIGSQIGRCGVTRKDLRRFWRRPRGVYEWADVGVGGNPR